MNEEKLGKIKKASFGLGGYQDVQIVFSFRLEGKGWGVIKNFECGWGHISEKELAHPNSNCEWTHDSRIKSIGQEGWRVIELMRDAKVSTLAELEGKPVRVNIVDGACASFEILKEVI